MKKSPKDDAARGESVRLQRALGRFLRLPVPVLTFLFRWAKRLFITPKSGAATRAADKERQAGVRRELRGLPTTHDQRGRGPDGDGTAAAAAGVAPTGRGPL